MNSLTATKEVPTIKRILLNVNNISPDKKGKIIDFFGARGMNAHFIETTDEGDITKQKIFRDNFSQLVRDNADLVILDYVNGIDHGMILSILGSRLCVMVIGGYNILSFLARSKELFGKPLKLKKKAA